MPLTLPFPTILKKCANVQCTNVPCYSMVFGASFFTATVCLAVRRPGILWRPVLRSGGLAFILHSAIPAISRIRICPSLPRNASVFIRFFSSMAKSSIKIAKNPASPYTGSGYNHSKEYKSSWKFIETHVLKKDMHVSKAISSHLRDRTPDCSPDIRLRYDTGSMIVILKNGKPLFPKACRLLYGVPERIRTSGTRFRRAVLYPAELQRHLIYYNRFSSSLQTDFYNYLSFPLLFVREPFPAALSTIKTRTRMLSHRYPPFH